MAASDRSGLVLAKQRGSDAMVRIPVTPRGSYRIQVVFANQRDDDHGFFALHLPIADSQVWLAIGSPQGVTGLFNVDGKNPVERNEGVPFRIEGRRKHELDITVELDGPNVILRALLNGKSHFAKQVPYSSLAPLSGQDAKIPDAELGLWSGATSCRIHKAHLELLSIHQ